MDKGHKMADEALRGLERKIKKEYTKAYKELKAEADQYFAQFTQRDKQMLGLMKSNKISKDEYLKWRSSTMLRTKQYQSLLDNLTNTIVNADKVANGWSNDVAVKMFVENYNFGHYEVATGTGLDLNFGLYNEDAVRNLIKNNPNLLPPRKLDIPKDMRWNRQKMNSALTRGILKGDSIPKIAKSLQSVTNMDRSSAIRNARTMMTSAQNAGRLQAYKDAQSKGIDLQKKWIATLDHVTRESHVDLDGEVVPLDETFSNGLDYPGGAGPAEEVYNCRCTMVTEIKGIKYEDVRNTDKLPAGESYEDWKERYKK